MNTQPKLGRPKNPDTPETRTVKCVVCHTEFILPWSKTRRKTCTDECLRLTRRQYQPDEGYLATKKKLAKERREYYKKNYITPLYNVRHT